MLPVIHEIRQRAATTSKRIVYPDSADVRVLAGVSAVSRLGIARPILVGDKVWIEKELRARRLSPGNIEVIEPNRGQAERYVDILLEDLRAQGATRIELRNTLKDPTEYAAAMIRANDADGLVTGPQTRGNQTGLTAIVRSIGRRSVPSRCFLVVPPEGGRRTPLIFADGMAMAAPGPHELAEIVLQACRFSQGLLQREARVGFLAPLAIARLERRSRFESAAGRLDGRVRRAIATLHARNGDLVVDRHFHRGLPADGSLNTYVFADPQPGNLRNQLVREYDGSRIVGPMLLGLRSPVSVLAPECGLEDVIDASAINVLS